MNGVEDPAGNIILIEYDAKSNPAKYTAVEGKDIIYTCELGRLVKTVDHLGKETLYSYDDRDNLIGLTDGEGNITTFAYDRNNRLLNETRPMGETLQYTYDAYGNLTGTVDPRNQKTEYIYDDVQRLVQVNYYAQAGDSTPARTVALTYDKVGRLTSYDDGDTSAAYTFDDAGRKLSESVNYGAFTAAHSYTYYGNGAKKTFTGPDGVALGYTYDSNANLNGVEIPAYGFISWSDFTWNRPKQVSYPGGSTRTLSYNPLMQVKTIGLKDPAETTVLSTDYTFNKAGNITGKSTEHGDYAYTYDDVYRLLTADNPVIDDEAYTYDGVGNRITSQKTTGDWAYNANNELETREDTVCTYDDNGNLVSKVEDGVTTVYHYTIDNRLTSIEDGSGSLTAQYGYDPFGRRLWKEVGGTRTYFHYADEGLVAELDDTGAVVKSYAFRPDSQWGTDPLFMKTGGDVYMYQNDHLGTPQKLVGKSGNVVWSASYDAFGKASMDVEVVGNHLRFPGQYYDSETGLHYNWNRYYDPGIGRYVTQDPIGLEGGINLYGYVDGNPLNTTDPKGESHALVVVTVLVLVVAMTNQRIIDHIRRHPPTWPKPEPPANEARDDVIILPDGTVIAFPPPWDDSLPEDTKEFCRQELEGCINMCFKLNEKRDCYGSGRGVYGESLQECILENCLPEICGGKPKE